jgi:hypothetical protein
VEDEGDAGAFAVTVEGGKRTVHRRGQIMDVPFLGKPSGFLPMVMSLIALGVVLSHFAIYGLLHEGAAQHVFQILMIGQIPMVGWFAAKWLPQGPKEALLVLLLQAGAGITALTSLYFLT